MVSTSEVAASKVALLLKMSTPIKEMHYVAAVDDTKISKIARSAAVTLRTNHIPDVRHFFDAQKCKTIVLRAIW